MPYPVPPSPFFGLLLLYSCFSCYHISLFVFVDDDGFKAENAGITHQLISGRRGVDMRALARTIFVCINNENMRTPLGEGGGGE